MPPFRIPFLLFSVAIVTLAAGPTLTGEWRIQRSAAGNDSSQICTFAQKDSQLRGTCAANGATVPLTGKIEGRAVTWTYKSDSQGGPVTVVYNGKLDSEGRITGTVTAVEFSIDGEFTATRSK